MWPGNIRKRPLTGPDLDSVLPQPKRPALSKEPGQANEDQSDSDSEHVSGSFRSSSSSMPTESDYDGISYDEMNQIMDHITASPKDLDQAHQHKMRDVQQMNPGPSNPSLPTEPPSTAEPTDPELNPDDQEMDRQAAIYAAKGKAKQLRRVSGTAREVA